jgi:hypothetical protein
VCLCVRVVCEVCLCVAGDCRRWVGGEGGGEGRGGREGFNNDIINFNSIFRFFVGKVNWQRTCAKLKKWGERSHSSLVLPD